MSIYIFNISNFSNFRTLTLVTAKLHSGGAIAKRDGDRNLALLINSMVIRDIIVPITMGLDKFTIIDRWGCDPIQALVVFVYLLLFCVLPISMAISGWVPTCDSAHSW